LGVDGVGIHLFGLALEAPHRAAVLVIEPLVEAARAAEGGDPVLVVGGDLAAAVGAHLRRVVDVLPLLGQHSRSRN